VPGGVLRFDRPEPTGVAVTVLWACGTHRGDSRWWTWPLPPPGRLDFICLLGAVETRVSVDARLILDAARRSGPAWTYA
jgi:hypothetical protein